ncbi:hypothetical protein AOQ84DRAFT_379147, partial [Glonium stellatum]
MATQADITNTDARDASASPKLTFETYAEYLRNNFLNPLLGSGPTFRAYRRFLAHLEESEGEHHPDSSVSFGFPYLNKFSFSLHRFDESGKSMASHNSKNVNRIEFTHILTHPDCSVTYQVVTLLFGDGYCPSWVVDVLGLQLGVPSHIWVYLFSSRPWARGELNTRTWIGSGERTTTMRIDSNHFIEIDDDALLILEDNAGVRPKTAIMFLGKARDQDEASFINILPWKPPLTRSPDPVICGVRRDAHTQGTFDDMKERTLLHFIKGRGQTPLAYGAGGFLFACLEALLCYHIARGLLGVPWFGKLHESYESKYGYEGRWNTDNIRERWNTIRGQTHYQRAALLSLPDFVHGNFNMKSGALKDAYELIKGKFERHVQKLDLEEARLRDIIDIRRSTGPREHVAQEDVGSRDNLDSKQRRYVPVRNHGHNGPEKSAARPRTMNPSRNWWDRLWIAELLSCFLAIAALVIIVIILATHQNKPMSQWPRLISINSLVSIFTSIMKAAMLLPVAEGISELKWLWFAQPRALVDLDRFDFASRGPWGSLTLLCKITRSYLAVFGAIITIAALAIDPFFQQMLQYYNCLEPIADSVALIPRTNNYTTVGMLASLDTQMAATIYMGMLNPPANASSSIPVTCSTGNCTFPAYEGGVSYSSLAMCSSTEIISHNITWNQSSQSYTLPSGASAGLPALFSSVGVETEYLYTFDTLMLDKVPCDSSSIGDGTFCSVKPLAVRCSLYPCLHTYGGNVSQSVLDERIISTTPLLFMNTVRGSYFSLAGNHSSFPSINCTPSDHPTNNNVVPTSRLSNGLQYIQQGNTTNNTGMQYYNPSCAWLFDIGPTTALSVYLDGIFGHNSANTSSKYPANPSPDTWLQQLYHNGSANPSTIDAFLSGLANAITATMRQRGDASNSAPAQGTVLGSQICVRVRWAW